MSGTGGAAGASIWRTLATRRSTTLTAGDINCRVIHGAGLIALLVGPIALATMVVGVGMHGFQGGWVVRAERAAVQLVAA